MNKPKTVVDNIAFDLLVFGATCVNISDSDITHVLVEDWPNEIDQDSGTFDDK